ncbi:MAG: cation transporter, partial [Steroidobacteraceae bacterium]
MTGASNPMGTPARAREHLVLPIGGMTCATCAGRVEKALNRLPGVEAVVNLASERADIRYDARTIAAAALVEAVRRAGYDAEPPTGDAVRDREIAAAAERRMRLESGRLAAAIVLSAPLLAPMAGVMLPGWLQLA